MERTNQWWSSKIECKEIHKVWGELMKKKNAYIHTRNTYVESLNVREFGYGWFHKKEGCMMVEGYTVWCTVFRQTEHWSDIVIFKFYSGSYSGQWRKTLVFVIRKINKERHQHLNVYVFGGWHQAF